MSWTLELAGQQRMIILEKFNRLTQLETNFNPIWNYSNVYIEWKKDLTQDCVKFEQVLPQTEDFFVDCKRLSAICKWTLFACTMYYFIPQLRCPWERIFLERKKQSNGYVIQELYLYSESNHLYH